LRGLDETGKRFGSLVALARAPSKSGAARWHCRCEACGGNAVVRADNLRSGRTTTCGCAGLPKVAPEFEMPTPKPQPKPNRETVRTVTVAPPPAPPSPGPFDWRAGADLALKRAIAELAAGK
jgi:hypothetical protein